jgi:alpha-glucosidase (family GH31 glycosyl hydrolase)
MQSAKGGWSDLTSKAGREWWAKGVESLIDYGMDGMWK